jgi:ANTAR domain
VLLEQAKAALRERERLDDQEAFTFLRRAARSSGRRLSEVAREVVAGRPLPRRRTQPTPPPTEQPNRDTGTPQLDA